MSLVATASKTGHPLSPARPWVRQSTSSPTSESAAWFAKRLEYLADALDGQRWCTGAIARRCSPAAPNTAEAQSRAPAPSPRPGRPRRRQESAYESRPESSARARSRGLQKLPSFPMAPRHARRGRTCRPGQIDIGADRRRWHAANAHSRLSASPKRCRSRPETPTRTASAPSGALGVRLPAGSGATAAWTIRSRRRRTAHRAWRHDRLLRVSVVAPAPRCVVGALGTLIRIAPAASARPEIGPVRVPVPPECPRCVGSAASTPPLPHPPLVVDCRRAYPLPRACSS